MDCKADLDKLQAEFLEFKARTEEVVKDLRAQLLEIKAEHKENRSELEKIQKKYKELEEICSEAWERSVRNRLALQHGFEASEPMRVKTGFDLLSVALPGEDSDDE